MATTTAPGGYTTIPPSTPQPPLSSADFPSRAAQFRNSIYTTLRPWRELFNPSSLGLPISFSEATFRIKNNLLHFRLNYAIIALIILFLSLIFHPISIIVFLITLAAWFFLHISRDEPLTLFNRTIDDRVVLILLSAVTILALILTRVWLNVVVSMLVSAFVACLHAALRFPDDVDDQESPYAALFSVVDSPRGAYSQVCDTDRPCLHLVYEMWDTIIEKVNAAIYRHEGKLQEDESVFYSVVHNIIVDRWAKSNTPLHCLAYSLNPRYYSSTWLDENFGCVPPHKDEEISNMRNKCFKKYFPNTDERRMVNVEYEIFFDFLENFGDFDSRSDRGVLEPLIWWFTHRSLAPMLQSLALKLLS